MKVEVHARMTDDGLVARCWVINDSAAIVDFDERCLIGPNVTPLTPDGIPIGVSVSAHADPSLPRVRLLAGQILGRERRFPAVRTRVRIHAYVVNDPAVALGLTGSIDGTRTVVVARPIEVG